MAEVSGADKPTRPMIKRQAVLRGYGLRTLAVAVIILGLLAAVLAPRSLYEKGGFDGLLATGISIVIWAPFVVLSLRLLRRSHRHRTVPAEIVLADDPRPPVLYLRSFTSDSRTARVDKDNSGIADFISIPSSFFSFVREWRGHSEEEYWSSAMSRIGPSVAIGAPGQLPFRGSARLYVSDDQWQAKVHELILQAALVVVLGGGGGEGLRWEIEQVSMFVSPERLVFLLPSKVSDFESLRSVLREIRDIEIGERPRVTHRMAICGLLRFDSDGSPDVRPVWGASQTDVALALKPVLDRLDQTGFA